jgi:hypothetical protein
MWGEALVATCTCGLTSAAPFARCDLLPCIAPSFSLNGGRLGWASNLKDKDGSSHSRRRRVQHL